MHAGMCMPCCRVHALGSNLQPRGVHGIAQHGRQCNDRVHGGAAWRQMGVPCCRPCGIRVPTRPPVHMPTPRATWCSGSPPGRTTHTGGCCHPAPCLPAAVPNQGGRIRGAAAATVRRERRNGGRRGRQRRRAVPHAGPAPRHPAGVLPGVPKGQLDAERCARPAEAPGGQQPGEPAAERAGAGRLVFRWRG